MAKNIYKVDKNQWKEWDKKAQNAFNEFYSYFKENQWVFKHPKSPQEKEEYWDTTAWNMAWTLADVVQREVDCV